jgi:hypothetical protein
MSLLQTTQGIFKFGADKGTIPLIVNITTTGGQVLLEAIEPTSATAVTIATITASGKTDINVSGLTIRATPTNANFWWGGA